MRVWDLVPPENLCRNHLLAEHRETLAIWSVLRFNKKGYYNHPEVQRWNGREGALFLRHNEIEKEAKNRGYNFKTLPYYPRYMNEIAVNNPDPWDDQITMLKSKNCDCVIPCDTKQGESSL